MLQTIYFQKYFSLLSPPLPSREKTPQQTAEKFPCRPPARLTAEAPCTTPHRCRKTFRPAEETVCRKKKRGRASSLPLHDHTSTTSLAPENNPGPAPASPQPGGPAAPPFVSRPAFACPTARGCASAHTLPSRHRPRPTRRTRAAPTFRPASPLSSSLSSAPPCFRKYPAATDRRAPAHTLPPRHPAPGGAPDLLPVHIRPHGPCFRKKRGPLCRSVPTTPLFVPGQRPAPRPRSARPRNAFWKNRI